MTREESSKCDSSSRTAPRHYVIPAVNMTRLEEEVEKMNKRADKLGCPRIIFKTIKTVTKKKTDPIFGFEYDYTVHHCTVEGEAPQLQGYTLIAILEPQPNAEMLVREVPGQMCPVKYRTTDLHCDHCGYTRRRNAVYLLHHAKKGYSQVGKQCLADFLGHSNPEAMLSAAEYLMDFAAMAGEAEDEGWGQGGGKGIRTVPVDHFVALCSILIRALGWVPRSAAYDDDDYDDSRERKGETRPTADRAWDLILSPKDEKNVRFIEKHKIKVEGRDLDLADDAVSWAEKIDPDTAGSTYLHDLGVCCRQQFVTWKTHGFVASVINAYQRDQANKLRETTDTSSSQHIGQVKQRLTIEGAKITFTKQFNSGQYPKTLVKFVDAKGNVLVWWASGFPRWIELNKTFNIVGTVSKHDEYNGQKQTELKRVEPCQLVA
jgi:hypothetical protein